MKQMNIFRFLAIAVLVLPAACVSEIMPDSQKRESIEQDTHSFTIRATLEQGITKSELTGNYDVVWNEGDQIRVFNTTNPEGWVFTLDAESAGSPEGIFNGPTIYGDGPFLASYPASLGGELVNGSIELDIPAVQPGAPGTFGQGANIAIGIAGVPDEISFRNLCGLLAITLSGDQEVSLIAITADNMEALNGAARISPSVASDPQIEWVGETSHSLTLEFESPVALSNQGTTFYMVVPAGTLANGFAVEVQDSAEGVMVKHASSDGSNQIVRSQIRPMPELAYVANFSRTWLEITNPGVYTGVEPGSEITCVLPWNFNPGQAAWNKPSSDTRSFRLQDWQAGYVYGVTLNTGTVSVGKSFSADLFAAGATNGLTSEQGVEMTVVRNRDGMLWLSDGAHGFIMLSLED